VAASLDDRMAGVLLAGGAGTRMLPLTARTNKHLLPVYMRPMIEHALSTLLEVGLRDVLVVTGRQHMGQVVECLGSGAAYGDVDFTYKVQEEARGIAQALALAERFAAGRRVAVMLSDNFFDDERVAETARSFGTGPDDPPATVFLARVADPRAYGVATVEGGRVVRIEEKPAAPASDLAVAGFYLYPPDVFDRVRALRPSARGELEVTDLNGSYLRDGRLDHRVVERWFDAGEPGPWMRAQRYVEEHADRFGPGRYRRRAAGEPSA
jgi:glucose-1-phosphate thymidylyltransferase